MWYTVSCGNRSARFACVLSRGRLSCTRTLFLGCCFRGSPVRLEDGYHPISPRNMFSSAVRVVFLVLQVRFGSLFSDPPPFPYPASKEKSGQQRYQDLYSLEYQEVASVGARSLGFRDAGLWARSSRGWRAFFRFCLGGWIAG